jgi:hypothetical protein
MEQGTQCSRQDVLCFLYTTLLSIPTSSPIIEALIGRNCRATGVVATSTGSYERHL